MQRESPCLEAGAERIGSGGGGRQGGPGPRLLHAPQGPVDPTALLPCFSGPLNGATFPVPPGTFWASVPLDHCVGGSWLQALQVWARHEWMVLSPLSTALDPQVAHSGGVSGSNVAPRFHSGWLGLSSRNVESFVIFFPTILHTALWEPLER